MSSLKGNINLFRSDVSVTSVKELNLYFAGIKSNGKSSAASLKLYLKFHSLPSASTANPLFQIAYTFFCFKIKLVLQIPYFSILYVHKPLFKIPYSSIHFNCKPLFPIPRTFFRFKIKPLF
jgi:hypothetical protein